MMKYELRPITIKEAAAFIKKHHRHHPPIKAWKIGVSVGIWQVNIDDTHEFKKKGVIVLSRPVGRYLDDKKTIEVTRCCTDGGKNLCSMLYGAAKRISKNLGYKRMITYTLKTENGSSLKASGFVKAYDTKGATWNRKNRPRQDNHPSEPKTLYICDL